MVARDCRAAPRMTTSFQSLMQIRSQVREVVDCWSRARRMVVRKRSLTPPKTPQWTLLFCSALLEIAASTLLRAASSIDCCAGKRRTNTTPKITSELLDHFAEKNPLPARNGAMNMDPVR